MHPLPLSISCALALLLAACATDSLADKPTTAAHLGGYYYYLKTNSSVAGYLELPPCPHGCVVRIYPANKESLAQGWLKVTDVKGLQNVDWSEHLREHGMLFPKGGFACYYPALKVLVIANTPDQLRLLDAM